MEAIKRKVFYVDVNSYASHLMGDNAEKLGPLNRK